MICTYIYKNKYFIFVFYRSYKNFTLLVLSNMLKILNRKRINICYPTIVKLLTHLCKLILYKYDVHFISHMTRFI